MLMQKYNRHHLFYLFFIIQTTLTELHYEETLSDATQRLPDRVVEFQSSKSQVNALIIETLSKKKKKTPLNYKSYSGIVLLAILRYCLIKSIISVTINQINKPFCPTAKSK